jgi:hypothetical protein
LIFFSNNRGDVVLKTPDTGSRMAVSVSWTGKKGGFGGGLLVKVLPLYCHLPLYCSATVMRAG